MSDRYLNGCLTGLRSPRRSLKGARGLCGPAPVAHTARGAVERCTADAGKVMPIVIDPAILPGLLTAGAALVERRKSSCKDLSQQLRGF